MTKPFFTHHNHPPHSSLYYQHQIVGYATIQSESAVFFRVGFLWLLIDVKFMADIGFHSLKFVLKLLLIYAIIIQFIFESPEWVSAGKSPGCTGFETSVARQFI